MAELARVPGLGIMRAEKIKKILDTRVPGNLLNNAQTKLIVNTGDNDSGSGDGDDGAVASNGE
jgi:DNA excision repair protein ERCC-4